MDSDHTKDTTTIELTILKLKSAIFRKIVSESGKELPASTPTVINLLREHYKTSDKSITVSEIADKINVSKSAVSQIVSSLEKHHIVRRKTSPEDKRLVYVLLTMKGRFFLKKINEHHKHTNILDELLVFLGDQDAKELVRLMSRVSTFLDQKEQKEAVKNA
jgi:DNA-binding MarR family transcriptional regulator